MEEEMRRVAIILGTIGIMALGLAATPAQAHDRGWGNSNWRQQTWQQNRWQQNQWRQHRYWQPRYYNQGHHQRYRNYGPRVMFGFSFR
jgi:hypothetical protein